MTTTVAPPAHPEGRTRVRPLWWRVLRGLLEVVAEPVREGRLRGETWHPGLRAMVAATLVLYAAELVLLAAVPFVRAHDDLVVVGSISLPRSTVFFFVAVVLWCLGLLHAACLHAPTWARVGSLLVVALTMATFAVTAGTSGAAWAVVGTGIAGLVVLTLRQWRRAPVWWEVPACLVLVATPSLVTLALGTAHLQELGGEGMPLLLSLQMQRLNALAMPAALVGGAAVAELAVSSADKVARAGARAPRVLVPVVLALGGWRLVDAATTATDIGETTSPVWVEWLGSAALLALAGAWGWWLVRSRRSVGSPDTLPDAPPGVEETAAEVGMVGPPLAVALLALLLPSTLLLSANVLLASAGREWSLLGSVNEHLVSTDTITWFRIAVGLLLLPLAVREARRGRVVRGLLLGEVGLVLVVIHLAMASDGHVRWPWTLAALVDVAAVAALVAFVVLAVRRRLTSARAAVLGTIVVVPWAFRFSDLIDSPFVTLLGLSGIGVTLFGLVWAFATGAADANGDSARYPRQTRVLLFLAQAVFGLLALVYAGIARGGSGLAFSPPDISELGSQVIGVPLLVAALVVMVWRMARD